MTYPSKMPQLGCREMVEITGAEYMMRQMAEECAELNHAALKLVRAMNGETPLPITAARANLIEEIADVKNMLRVFESAILNTAELKEVSRIQDAKMQRFSDRIRERP